MCLLLLVSVAAVVTVVVVAFVYHLFLRDNFRPESVAGKRVLITGAASGIGKKTAYSYSRLRASLVIVDCRQEPLAKVAAKCKRLGAARVQYVVADLAVAEDRDGLVDLVRPDGLDCLVLVHGIMTASLWMGTAEELATLERLMNVNFFSHVHLVSMCTDMLTASRGSIGIVSAVNGEYPSVFAQSYSATKFALVGFFSALRQELKFRRTGISITIVVLGYTATKNVVALMRKTFPAYDMKGPADVDGAVAAIVRGVSTRAARVYHPNTAWIICQAYHFVPSLVEHYFSTRLLAAAAPAHRHPWTSPCGPACRQI